MGRFGSFQVFDLFTVKNVPNILLALGCVFGGPLQPTAHSKRKYDFF